ncbi:MAG: hypothetical protein IKB42_02940 [Clostridia bacterium]|nr:hypothetical protein [Clostridia bacterium]
MSETPNPYTSEKKKKPLMDLYKKGNFPEEGKQPKKVNLATADELENATLAKRMEFAKKLKQKHTLNISNVVVELPKGCDHVELFPLSSLNIFDTSNPGKSVRDDKYINELCRKLNKNSIVVMGGDLFGKQWKMADLAKADITEDNKVMWFGINYRLKELIKIVTKLLNTDAHIVLMRGSQENEIMKRLDGRDVIQELIDTVILKGKAEKGNLYYVNEGVQEIIQLAKPNSRGKIVYYPIELRTNNALSKTTTAKGYLSASIKSNGEPYAEIPSIDFNGNIVGQINENHYSVSPEKVYNETPVGKKPTLSPKTYNQLTMFLNDDGTMDIVQGDSNFLTEDNTAEIELSKKLAHNTCLFDLAESKLREEKFKAYGNIVSKK